MSRSKRKNSITGIAVACSEKYDKRICNRKLRRVNKEKVKKGDDIFLKKHEAMNQWEMQKDGKMYFDEEKFPELMRK